MPRTIEQIEADIEAVKESNPNWAANVAALNAIASFTDERNQVTQSYKFPQAYFDPVEAFSTLLGKKVDEDMASVLFRDTGLVNMLRNNIVQKMDVPMIVRRLQSIVTTRRAEAFHLNSQYLFDGLLNVPSKQESTCLQYVVEGSKLRVAKTTTAAELDPEIAALNLIHQSHHHCPTIVPLLDCCESGEGRRSMIFPYFGLALSQLEGSRVPDMVALHANVAMCGLATIMACNHVGLCHGDIKPGNMMLTDSGVVVTIDFGETCTYGSFPSGSTRRFGMDARLATLKYDLACLASTLLVQVNHYVGNLQMEAVQKKYNDSPILAERLAAILVSTSDLETLWVMCDETIQKMVVDTQGQLLQYDTLKPLQI